MRTFQYEARDRSNNKIIKATVQADTERSAAKLLLDQGFVPLKIQVKEDSRNFITKYTNRIKNKDKIIFLRQMATLIGAGLPLSQSLNTILNQTSNKRMQDIIQQVINDVEGGKSLSQAFSKHPEAFDNIVLALVSAGEASGTLDESLRRVAVQKEKDAAMISKVRGAMVYPAIVLLVIIAVMLFMLIMVVPEVSKIYADMNKGLPFLTAMMIVVAEFILSYWWLIIILTIVGVYFMIQYSRTESGVKVADTLKLNVPIFGSLFRKLYMARFTRTGQTLLTTGVPMLDMLRISADGVNNVMVAENIDRAAEKVKGGRALSKSLEPEQYILPMVPQMIGIGEQSGKIDEMMGKTAQVYEDEVDEEIRVISTTIEPVLMVVMAIMAGGMVGAILFPIYALVGG